LGISKTDKYNKQTPNLTFARMSVHVHATYCHFIFFMKWNSQNGCFVFKRYAVREAKTWRYAVRKAEIGRHTLRRGRVTLMVMDCGTCIIFIRFRIPDQVYCNKSQKNNNFLFKTFILQILKPSSLLHRLGTVLRSPFMWMLVFMLKEDRC